MQKYDLLLHPIKRKDRFDSEAHNDINMSDKNKISRLREC